MGQFHHAQSARTLSGTRFEFRATMPTALQRLLRLAEKWRTNVDDTLKSVKLRVDVRRRLARRRRSDVVVLGKHVPSLAFVGLLMDHTPALAAEYGVYRRLLARDQSEAAELIDSHIKTGTAASVYDALLLPALSYAERDRLEHRLSSAICASESSVDR